TGIKEFDKLISDGGLEKNSSILISGGAGTGKTTFSIQSIYHSAINRGEKGIYLSFEEEPEKIKLHMKKNFGWDLNALEKKGLFAIIKIDPVDISRSVEQVLMDRKGELKIDMKKIELPFLPDKIVVDSLSALSIAFNEEDSYRKYIRELFESMEKLNCTSYVITETEQDPKVYSRTGVEEFLADGVIVLYNIKKDGQRENAIEILKLRSSSHKKGMTPYTITKEGITILEN
ncbi:MAG: ATPase domain-containing protein, partial [Candidatus Diapherotrites archaeon]